MWGGGGGCLTEISSGLPDYLGLLSNVWASIRTAWEGIGLHQDTCVSVYMYMYTCIIHTSIYNIYINMYTCMCAYMDIRFRDCRSG